MFFTYPEAHPAGAAGSSAMRSAANSLSGAPAGAGLHFSRRRVPFGAGLVQKNDSRVAIQCGPARGAASPDASTRLVQAGSALARSGCQFQMRHQGRSRIDHQQVDRLRCRQAAAQSRAPAPPSPAAPPASARSRLRGCAAYAGIERVVGIDPGGGPSAAPEDARSICSASVVLPEEDGPNISTMRPRGHPPPSASSRRRKPVGKTPDALGVCMRRDLCGESRAGGPLPSCGRRARLPAGGRRFGGYGRGWRRCRPEPRRRPPA